MALSQAIHQDFTVHLYIYLAFKVVHLDRVPYKSNTFNQDENYEKYAFRGVER
jgi:hypothetical protein